MKVIAVLAALAGIFAIGAESSAQSSAPVKVAGLSQAISSVALEAAVSRSPEAAAKLLGMTMTSAVKVSASSGQLGRTVSLFGASIPSAKEGICKIEIESVLLNSQDEFFNYYSIFDRNESVVYKRAPPNSGYCSAYKNSDGFFSANSPEEALRASKILDKIVLAGRKRSATVPMSCAKENRCRDARSVVSSFEQSDLKFVSECESSTASSCALISVRDKFPNLYGIHSWFVEVDLKDDEPVGVRIQFFHIQV